MRIHKWVSSRVAAISDLPEVRTETADGLENFTRTAMFSAHTFLMTLRLSGIPRYEAPTTQSNSAGNQLGRAVLPARHDAAAGPDHGRVGEGLEQARDRQPG